MHFYARADSESSGLTAIVNQDSNIAASLYTPLPPSSLQATVIARYVQGIWHHHADKIILSTISYPHLSSIILNFITVLCRSQLEQKEPRGFEELLLWF